MERGRKKIEKKQARETEKEEKWERHLEVDVSDEATNGKRE